MISKRKEIMSNLQFLSCSANIMHLASPSQ